MNERNYLSIFRGEPEVMTVVEAAKLLRVGKNKAYSLISSGKLKSIKIGGKILVPKLCLVGFLTDENNYQFSSQFASDSLWTSAKCCGSVCSADGGTGI